MKLFLDSANTEEIRHALKVWDLNGITTNPKHVFTSGKSFKGVIREIADILSDTDKPISVEVNPHLTDHDQIVEQARELAAISPQFVIKIGMSEPGCAAIRTLSGDGIRVNATLIFSVAQAWHAARAGAAYVSPFLGWREAHGDPGISLIRGVREMLDAGGYDAEIIASAIRNGWQIGEAARAGADCVTAGFAVYQDSFRSPYSTMGERIFQEAWDKTHAGA
ncbi:MAG: transaldolase family protein [Longimicrobiales bacterium]|nr:transaldolase family protein [Longimicrobiales bacterium]